MLKLARQPSLVRHGSARSVTVLRTTNTTTTTTNTSPLIGIALPVNNQQRCHFTNNFLTSTQRNFSTDSATAPAVGAVGAVGVLRNTSRTGTSSVTTIRSKEERERVNKEYDKIQNALLNGKSGSISFIFQSIQEVHAANYSLSYQNYLDLLRLLVKRRHRGGILSLFNLLGDLYFPDSNNNVANGDVNDVKEAVHHRNITIVKTQQVLTARQKQSIFQKLAVNTISGLISFNQYQDGLQLWMHLTATNHLITTEALVCEMMQQLSTTHSYIPQVVFIEKLHTIMTANQYNRTPIYYTHVLTTLKNHLFNTLIRIDEEYQGFPASNANEGIRLLDKIWMECTDMLQSIAVFDKHMPREQVMELLMFRKALLDCQLVVFQIQQKAALEKKQRQKQQQQQQQQAGKQVDAAEKESLTTTTSHYSVDAIVNSFETLLFIIQEGKINIYTNNKDSNKDNNNKDNKDNKDKDTTTKNKWQFNEQISSFFRSAQHTFKLLGSIGQDTIIVNLFSKFLMFTNVTDHIHDNNNNNNNINKNNKEETANLWMVQELLARIIRKAEFTIVTSIEFRNDRFSNINNNNDNNSTPATASTSTTTSASAGERPPSLWSSVLNVVLPYPSTTDSATATTTTAPAAAPTTIGRELLVQDINRLNNFANQLLTVAKRYHLPVSTEFYGNWISALMPTNMYLLYTHLPKSSSYSHFYSIFETSSLTQQQQLPSPQHHKDLLKLTTLALTHNLPTDWKSLLEVAYSIRDRLAGVENTIAAGATTTRQTPELLYRIVKMLALFESVEPLEEALKVMFELAPLPMSVDNDELVAATFNQLMLSSLLCHDNIKAEDALGKIETVLKNKYGQRLLLHPTVLRMRIRMYARLKQGGKAFSLLRTLRQHPNIRMHHSDYNWLSHENLDAVVRDANKERRVVAAASLNTFNTDTTGIEEDNEEVFEDALTCARQLVSMMVVDGVEVKKTTVSSVMKMFVKAARRPEHRGQDVIFEQAQEFLEETCYFNPINNRVRLQAPPRESSNAGFRQTRKVMMTTEMLVDLIRICCFANDISTAKQIINENIAAVKSGAIDKRNNDTTKFITTADQLYDPLIEYYTQTEYKNIQEVEDLVTHMCNQQLKPSPLSVWYCVLYYLDVNDPTEALDFAQEIFNQHGVRLTDNALLSLLDYSLERKDNFEANRVAGFIRRNVSPLERLQSVAMPGGNIFVTQDGEIIPRKIRESIDEANEEGGEESERDNDNNNKADNATNNANGNGTTATSYLSRYIAGVGVIEMRKTASQGLSPLMMQLITKKSNLLSSINKPNVIVGALTEVELQKRFLKHGCSLHPAA